MSGGSRFSRYFRRESPPPTASATSAHSADEAQEQMLASIINGQPSRAFAFLFVLCFIRFLVKSTQDFNTTQNLSEKSA